MGAKCIIILDKPFLAFARNLGIIRGGSERPLVKLVCAYF